MSEFEYILACLLIPVVYVMTYIAGKYDVLSIICKMLEKKTTEYKETKLQNKGYKKPNDIEEIQKFIFDKLKEEYGDNVISENTRNKIVVDTDTKKNGNSDVWIDFSYFH